MSTVTLGAVFLNDAEDPADSMQFATVGDSYRIEETLGGGVEHGYASGRSRLYSTEDDVTTVPLTLVDVTPAQVAWLRSHRGRVVCFRDNRGAKVFGAYLSLPVEFSTMPVDDAIDTAALSLTSTTWSEAV